MASPPRLKTLKREDFPGVSGPIATVLDQLFPVLNSFFTEVSAALERGITRRENMRSGIVATTHKTGASAATSSTVTIKNPLPTKPELVWVGRLARADRTELANAFSMSWVMNQKDQVVATFQGLENSTEYSLTLVCE